MSTNLYDLPGHRIRRVNQIIVARFTERCQATGITPVQYAAMMAIRHEGATDATQISATIGFDRATLGSVLDRLEKRGLIARGAHPTDRRVKVISLTPAGNAALDEVHPLVLASQGDFMSLLDSDEQGQLMRLLDKIIRKSEHFAGPSGDPEA
ncbi:MarR family winged helix-turn-helix transcriptional regulator [Pararhodobacter sp.]|uniref:MarR family winged helix-turn-helix transcriptional regulator n=1 Tax=Pararhodobacter sp. TaxID=2127056 RepID=UPI002FE03949